MAGLGLVRVLSNADLDRIAQEKQAAEAPPLSEMSWLSAHVQRAWEAARDYRRDVEARMLRSLRMRMGEYDPDKLAEIRAQGGSEIFMMIPATKCRAAEAWINDIMAERPWNLEPTPVPELSPENEAMLQQRFAQEILARNINLPPDELNKKFEEAKEQFKQRLMDDAKVKANAMADLIEDQLEEGGWRATFAEFRFNVTTYPSAFLKSPVFRREKTLAWAQGPQGFTPEITEEIKLNVEAPSPLDIYPEPGCSDVNDGYLIEVHRFSRGDLSSLIGVPGYDEATIRKILEEFDGSGLNNWLMLTMESERMRLESGSRSTYNTGPDGFIYALEFHGSVSGRMLTEWGVKDIADPDQEYQAIVWKVGRHVFRATLNDDPMGRKPYFKASYDDMGRSFWGNGVPDLIVDSTTMCNAAARSVANNMAISSGPMVDVNIDRIPPGQDVTSLYPWKIFQTTNDPSGSVAPAVRFYQPNAMVEPLMGVFERFSRIADDESHIPPYAYGNPSGGSGGALSTASGMSMMFSHASKGIKQVVGNIDRAIGGLVESQYIHNMIHHPDQSMKGDCKVVTRGASSGMAKEQNQIRRAEFLDKTANPIDMAIMGKRGRAALLRESVKTLDIAADDVIPSREDMDRAAAAESAAMQPPPGMPPGAPPGGPPGRALDQAGNPVAGQDTALFRG